jgi:hypothetical protein
LVERYNRDELVFEAVISFLGTMLPFSDIRKPNDTFSINGMDILRNYDNWKLL